MKDGLIGMGVGYEARDCQCLMQGIVSSTENWQHTGSDTDIVRYKPMTQEETDKFKKFLKWVENAEQLP